MFVRDRVPDLVPRCVGPRLDARRRVAVAAVYNSRLRPLHFIENLFGLRWTAMNQKPARTFRNPAAKEDNDQAESRADSKGQAPAEPDWKVGWIQQHNRSAGTHCRANPVGAVD